MIKNTFNVRCKTIQEKQITTIMRVTCLFIIKVQQINKENKNNLQSMYYLELRKQI